MKADITERISNQPLPATKAKRIWVDVAIGVYVGGMGVLITSVVIAAIISTATMGLVMEAQEKLLNKQIKKAEKTFQSIIPQPKTTLRNTETTQQSSWHKVIDNCAGFKNRASMLQENLKIPRLIDNYSSTEQMNDELKSLLETIKKDCHKQ